jgi:hypothetical protein
MRVRRTARTVRFYRRPERRRQAKPGAAARSTTGAIPEASAIQAAGALVGRYQRHKRDEDSAETSPGAEASGPCRPCRR